MQSQKAHQNKMCFSLYTKEEKKKKKASSTITKYRFIADIQIAFGHNNGRNILFKCHDRDHAY